MFEMAAKDVQLELSAHTHRAYHKNHKLEREREKKEANKDKGKTLHDM